MKKFLSEIFCKHQWEEKERFFCAGSDLEGGEGRITMEALKVLLEHCKPKTTILYKCKLCEKPMCIEVKGKAQ